jgi:CBS domain containing-hemolysin-like protein
MRVGILAGPKCHGEVKLMLSQRNAGVRAARWMLAVSALLAAGAAHASFFAGEALDTAANVISWFVLIVMPPAAIGLFWMVHVLPQKAAEKRHHPQKEAIHVLCLLSLVFGGLLWPIAWLWAYSRPTMHALAHGTERHEDFFTEQAELAEAGELTQQQIAMLCAELDGLAARGLLKVNMGHARDRLKRVEAGEAAAPHAEGAA